MKTLEVLVDKDMCDALESLSYEVESMKAVIKDILTSNPNNINILNSAIFKEFNQNYINKMQEYETLKLQMQNQYIDEELRNAGAVSTWDLNFQNQILTITLMS